MNDRYADLEDHERALALLDELGRTLERLKFEEPHGNSYNSYTVRTLLAKALDFAEAGVRQHAMFERVPGWYFSFTGRVLGPNDPPPTAADFLREITG